VYLSVNNGNTWSKVNTGLTNTTVNALSISSGDTIYAGTNGGVFMTVNNGNNWQAVNNGLSSSLYILSLATNRSRIYAGTDGGVYISLNGGANWASANNGLQINAEFYALAVSGDTLFAGSGGNGVYYSKNNGGNWSQVNNGLADTVYALIKKGRKLFAGTDNGVYLTTNNGSNWAAAKNGLPSFFTYVLSLAICDSNIFAGMEFIPGYANGGVYLSANNGNNWSTLSAGLTNTSINALAINGSDIFAGTNGGGVFINATTITPQIIQSGDTLISSSSIGNQWYLAGSKGIITGATDQKYIPSQNGSYYDIVSQNAFSSRASDTINYSVTLINEKEEIHFEIYPNPALNDISIEYSQDAIIEILNIQGQPEETITTFGKKTTIDVSAFPNGVYIVEVKTKNGVEVRKFIKE
jgi:photosystem II stability/assembly factor-like uncharacterized protein